MNKYRRLAILAALLIACTSAYAQTTPPDTTKKLADTIKKPVTKTLYVNVGLDYLSNLTYAGRRLETSVPVLLPLVTLVSKQGLFLNAAGYFDLNGSKSQTEGFSVTPGYVFAFDKPKRYYGGSISFTKYFITGSSPIILSTFNATIDGQLYANPQDIIKMTLGGSFRFNKDGEKNDNVDDFELSKDIWLFKESKNKTNGLKITPDATLYMGTQSFYSTLIVGEDMPAPTLQETRRYDFLAFTGSAELYYVIKKVHINFTPYYIKPFNTTQDGWYFLFTAGANVTF